MVNILNVMNFVIATTDSSDSSSSSGTGVTLIIYVVVIGLMMYFMIIRPQQKQKKKQAELMSSMAVGDSVLTTAGFYGVIIDMTDDTVIVEFGSNKNCRIPMQKAAIVQVEKPAAPAAGTPSDTAQS